MKDKLLVATKIKKTIEYLDKVVCNFPNTESVLRTRILNTMYDMLEFTYMANIGLDGRKDYQKRVVVYIRMIDYYLKLSVDKKYISFKKYEQIGNHLVEINNLLMAWINCEKSK